MVAGGVFRDEAKGVEMAVPKGAKDEGVSTSMGRSRGAVSVVGSVGGIAI